MQRGGTHKSKLSPNWVVYNYDPKPYVHFEYWECPNCYWRQKTEVKSKIKDFL